MAGTDTTDLLYVEGAITVYKEHVAVISEIKSRQWMLTNYIALLYGAIIFLDSRFKTQDHCLLTAFLIFLSVLVGFWGTTALCCLQLTLTKRRKRLRSARNELGELAAKVYGNPKPAPKFTDDWVILGPMLGITALGAIFSILIITFGEP